MYFFDISFYFSCQRINRCYSFYCSKYIFIPSFNNHFRHIHSKNCKLKKSILIICFRVFITRRGRVKFSRTQKSWKSCGFVICFVLINSRLHVINSILFLSDPFRKPLGKILTTVLYKKVFTKYVPRIIYIKRPLNHKYSK